MKRDLNEKSHAKKNTQKEYDRNFTSDRAISIDNKLCSDKIFDNHLLSLLFYIISGSVFLILWVIIYHLLAKNYDIVLVFILCIFVLIVVI